MKFSSKDIFSKCYQIRRKLRIWSHLLKKFLIENLISCAVLMSRNSGLLKTFFLLLLSSSSKIHICRRQKSVLLTSNELLLMLTKTKNHFNQKIVNVMTYKVHTHRRTHMYIYHCFRLLSKSASVSVLTTKVQ